MSPLPSCITKRTFWFFPIPYVPLLQNILVLLHGDSPQNVTNFSERCAFYDSFGVFERFTALCTVVALCVVVDGIYQLPFVGLVAFTVII